FEVVVPADERRRQSGHPTRPHQGKRPDQSTTLNSFRLALRFERSGVVELEGAANGGDRALADEDLAGIGRLFEPRRDIDWISRYERAAGAGAPDDDIARVHTDSQGKTIAEDLLQPIAHRERGMQRPLALTFVRDL